MKRRSFLASLLLTGATFDAQAQPLSRGYRIGLLHAGSIARSTGLQSLWPRLRELGYVEGRNLEIIARAAEGRVEVLPKLAAELVSLNPNVIVAVTSPSVQAVKGLTQSIPIVMAVVADPLGSGFVESLARPGGNITGIADNSLEIVDKRIEVLKECLPQVARIGFLWNTKNPNGLRGFERAESSSTKLGVQIVSLPVSTPEELNLVLDQPAAERQIEAVVTASDPMTLAYRKEIINAAARHRLPTMFTSKEPAYDGALITYGTNFMILYSHVAACVDKILKGANPATLPVEYPTGFELVINMKTAATLGLTIPLSLLARADEVIE